jgi:hypothetical protein
VKRLLVFLTSLALLGSFSLPASGDQSEGGFTSKWVKWEKFIPFEVGTATGARIIGNYLYMTSWRSFSIYDVSKPLDPQLVSQTFWGELGDDAFEFESEDMPTNGKILIMSETEPRNVLHIIDVRDPSNPKQIANMDTTAESGQHSVYSDTGGGSDAYTAANHTMSCLFDCTWLWGSTGAIVDLRDPAHPKLIKHRWNDGLPGEQGHDVIEVKPGYVLTSTEPMMYLDAHDPVHPKLLALGHAKDNRFIHSVFWPNGGDDKFVLSSGETNFTPACTGATSGDLANGQFVTWSTKGWEKAHTFHMIDQVHLTEGAYVDGNPPLHVLGCSTHWFDPNPTFSNGGVVAEGAYENGARFWGVTPEGKIKDYGYFEPYFGSTSAEYWRTDRVVYSIDYERGFDVLRYTGPLEVK